jgi:hypothetical protein
MKSSVLLDCAGRRRSPAALPGYHQGRPPRNKGLRYPPDPPTVEEIIAVMRAGGENVDGLRFARPHGRALASRATYQRSPRVGGK